MESVSPAFRDGRLFPNTGCSNLSANAYDWYQTAFGRPDWHSRVRNVFRAAAFRSGSFVTPREVAQGRWGQILDLGFGLKRFLVLLA